MPSRKQRHNRGDIAKPVHEFLSLLAEENPGMEIHVGGSWRRQTPTVGDLDILLVTDDLGDVRLPRVFVDLVTRAGPKVVQSAIPVGAERLLQIDLWSTTEHALGPYLWFVTGPADLNIAMRASAKQKGWKLAQKSLTGDRGQDLLDGLQRTTEQDIAQALNVPMLAPVERSNWKRYWKQTTDQRTVEIVGSSGTKYLLSMDGPAGWCTCPGYSYRGDCKHVRNPEEFM